MTSTHTLPSREPAAITLNDVVISQQLVSRRMHEVDQRAEIGTLHALAQALPRGPQHVLRLLAQTAIDLCGAHSGGISVLEDPGQQFRWVAMAGELAGHVGGTTPRDWSPCGECLNAGRPMLYSYPGRYFTYFQQVSTPIVEGLVIPMPSDGAPLGTIWVVSHSEGRHFDAADVRVMTSLAEFVTAMVRRSTRDALSGDPFDAEREFVWTELLRRIAGGDLSALEPLMEETRPFVFSRALRILSSPADAEEATSDVYLQVWKIANRYNTSRRGVLAWLLNLTRSRAIDRLRLRTREGQSLEAALVLGCGRAMDPELDAARGQTRKNMCCAMLALPVEQKRVLEMAYFEGYSALEIAQRLGNPVGTVKTRWRSGLIALRLLLSTQGGPAWEGRHSGRPSQG